MQIPEYNQELSKMLLKKKKEKPIKVESIILGL